MRETVSVIVLTYNPDREKLFATLNSIIIQENIDIEIIVSDDGSMHTYFSDIKELFAEKAIVNYRVIKNEKNVGTVKNAISGIKVAHGKYVKLISPGDMLTNKNVLSEWISALASSGKKWSFCDALFYRLVNRSVVLQKQKCHPSIVDVYKKKKDDECRWNYVMANDVALGAAILCEKDVLLQYLYKVEDKVKYTEDSVFKIMMFDGICAYYFENEAILYECESGISTQNSERWNKIIGEDWTAADNVMLSRPQYEDKFQKEMHCFLSGREKYTGYLWVLKVLMEPRRIGFETKKRIYARYSPVELPDELKEVNWYAHN